MQDLRKQAVGFVGKVAPSPSPYVSPILCWTCRSKRRLRARWQASDIALVNHSKEAVLFFFFVRGFSRAARKPTHDDLLRGNLALDLPPAPHHRKRYDYSSQIRQEIAAIVEKQQPALVEHLEELLADSRQQ